MTQILGNQKQGLFFEIVSARISDEQDVGKRHVIYTIQVRFISSSDDLKPAAIDRRYTQFLNLYNGLKKDEPQLMANITFPKKKLFGNFDNDLITQRSTEFQTFLNYVSSESKLRFSNAMLVFLQENELAKAKSYLELKNYTEAAALLEQNFILLNKVFTDRSAPVLIALCRLLGCCIHIPNMPNAYKWGQLALHRFEGVSDSDLLELYVPLVYSCIRVWQHYEKEQTKLEDQLLLLKRQGISIANNGDLLEEVNKVEKNIFHVTTEVLPI